MSPSDRLASRPNRPHASAQELRFMNQTASNQAANAGTKGLEGIIAANSEICFIDGKVGRLLYQGYNIHELADQSTFEEVCYLLWRGQLPNRDQLDRLDRQLRTERAVYPEVLSF